VKITLFALMVLTASQLFSQNTIKDARTAEVGERVTVSGILINGDELGTIKYVQDSTGGIAIYDSQLADAKRGDSITVSGELDDYYNLLEIKNVSNYTLHSSDNQLPTPQILNANQLGENYEGQLIRIDSIEINNAGGTFASNENYTFSDGTNTGELRISSTTELVGQIIPSGTISLVGICSQYSYTSNNTISGYQIILRDADDLISGSSIQITSTIDVVDISKNSISLSWTTDGGTYPFVRYGDSNNESSLTNVKTGDSTTSDEDNINVVEITGLQASQIVYAQVFSVFETDTAFSSIGVYVTESNSSGNILVYFNTMVNEQLADETDAKYIIDAMADTLSAYINKAEESIDLCIYNFDNSTIRDALNAANERGLKIRVITCGSTSHSSIYDLSSIPFLERPEISDGGIMHNKFAIFDGNSSDANKVWLWSGSTNLTQAQLTYDANNMIFIQDQSLAKTYEIEFEEMWGSTGEQADAENARFGEDKTNNTPHELIIGGSRVECYFSPSDNTNQKLIDAIETADYSLGVQTMLITRSDLANAIVDAKDRGAEVNVITDSESSNTETVNSILSSELAADKYIFDDTVGGLLHHKMAIIDVTEETSDPQVITGSHNWSNAANDENDENTLIIHNADISNQYYQQFAYRFEENGGELMVSTEEIEIEDLKIYPNPTTAKIQISSNENIEKIELYSIQGNLVKQIIPMDNQTIEIDLSTQISGVYILKIETENEQSNSYKIVKK
jgi:phosphatidylserine/phosphatidylglycerophosphate/cardiolipin synthase-like enzyme